MTTTPHSGAGQSGSCDYITFHLDDMLMGIDIQQVQEINHNLDCTPVPHAGDTVCGVINLRGEVVTVLDLRRILRLADADPGMAHRNIVINAQGENIGLVIDRISDVVSVATAEIEPAPANLNGLENRFFNGVYKMENQLLLLLNIEEIALVELCETADNN